ncbi:MAG: TlpA family protein disulfide reductase [Proteobacteria bacterium]|nr:TlpA family protein disulfide reductase [Pseudomonadota bacterium]
MRRLPLLFLALLALSCSGGDGAGTDGGGSEPAATPEEERPLGIKVGFQAPDFTLPRIGNEGEMSLSELRGKVVLMSFWASWCGPCRVEVPALEEAWSTYKDKDVVILGVSTDDTSKEAEAFLGMFPVTYPMLLDLSGRTIANGMWRVQSLPTSVIIDKNGVVRERHIGFTPAQLRDTLVIVDQLLQE